MPISNTDLQELAKVSLDDYLRKLPVEQIALERPFLKKLLEGRKTERSGEHPQRAWE